MSSSGPFEDGWRPRAVVFDLDDTLLRSSEADRAGLERTVAHFQGSFNGLAPVQVLERHAALLREVQATYAKTGAWMYPPERFARLLADAGGDPAVASHMAEHYLVARLEVLEAYPGVGSLLAGLRSASMRLAILSNGPGPMQRRALDRFGFAPFFDAVLLAGEVGLRKPDPGMFRLALDRLGVAPEETLMVGDSYALDVVPAIGLGMHAVHVAGAPEDGRSHLFHRPGDPLEGPCTLRVPRVTDLVFLTVPR